MKQIILASCLCCMALQAVGQKRSSFKVLAEATTFLNLNGGDIKGNNAPGMIQQQTTAGGNFGLGFTLTAPRNMIVRLSMGLRFNPQHLEFGDEGFAAVEKFVNTDYYLRFSLAYSFPVTPATRMEIGMGFRNDYSLNGRSGHNRLYARPYTNTGTGETLNYLSNVYSINQGDSRKGEDRGLIPFMFNPLIHLGILNNSLLPHKRQLGLFIEGSSTLGYDHGSLNSNQAYIHRLGPDRNIIATERYRDQYTAISLTLSVVLF